MVVIDFGYKSYIVSGEQALALIGILEKAEVYERKYLGASDYSHHVYQNEEGFTLRTINEGLYQMAKLAGKPTKEK